MNLRDYQHQVIEELRRGLREGHTRQMLYLPTGAGKTLIAAAVIRNAVLRGKKPMFIVHMKQLVLQAKSQFERAGLKVGILQGDNTAFSQGDDVLVASIQTIHRRNAPEWCNLVIIDEAHLLHKAHIALMDEWADIPFIGLSATPLRADLGKHFTNLVTGATVRELTDSGYLVPTKAFCPEPEKLETILAGLRVITRPQGKDWSEGDLEKALNVPTIVGDVVSTWQRHGEDRQTLAFCVTKAHSRSLVEAFVAEGILAAHIEDRTPADERQELIAAFNRKEIRILSSVGVLSIGFDSPIASCGILARPTQSEALHMQQVGRLLRPCEGKQDAILLDHGGNVLRHGLPIDFEVHSLGTGKHEQKSSVRTKGQLTVCTACWYVLEVGQSFCPKCGVDRPKPQPNVNVADGELVEYGSGKKGAEVYTTEEKRAWWLGFKWHADKRGFKRGWAWHKYREKFAMNPASRWEHDSPSPPSEAQLRWLKFQQIRHAKGAGRKPDACRGCGSTTFNRTPGKGPHAAGLVCADCGAFVKWLSKGEISSTEALGGEPKAIGW